MDASKNEKKNPERISNGIRRHFIKGKLTHPKRKGRRARSKMMRRRRRRKMRRKTWKREGSRPKGKWKRVTARDNRTSGGKGGLYKGKMELKKED